MYRIQNYAYRELQIKENKKQTYGMQRKK
jgi:hypothetical protein